MVASQIAFLIRNFLNVAKQMLFITILQNLGPTHINLTKNNSTTFLVILQFSQFFSQPRHSFHILSRPHTTSIIRPQRKSGSGALHAHACKSKTLQNEINK